LFKPEYATKSVLSAKSYNQIHWHCTRSTCYTQEIR